MDLKQKAIELAAVYKQNSKIEAILLAGSVSKNLHDEHSDIEIHILWKTPPEDQDRQLPIHKIGGSILAYHPYEEEEWSESFLTKDGIKAEISNFLSSTVERFINDVVDRYETNYDKQCVVASIDDGVILFGEEQIKELKKKIAVYPLALSKQMISENLWLENRWNNREALLNRKDWLMLYEVFCDVQKKLFGVLFGLNKMYVHHPSFKWMHHNIEQMRIKPEKLYERMSNILIGSPENSVKDMESLIEEVLVHVETHLPDLNINEQKKHIRFAK
ncbi:DUF4037 domain-containing protein [Metabacillus sp. Hm71]|uniref:DUF4037 domain-containing protein n=1 Tax=Metabacillus sp. Hm71 TaxID=3450743 RepID=UPI003F43F168